MKFVIPRGKEFYCEFQIKEPNSNTPMDLAGAHAYFTLSTIGVNPCIVLDSIPMTVKDEGGAIGAKNGIVELTLTSDQTKDLKGRKGFPEDGYPLVPTYSASIAVRDAAYPIDVQIPKVYVLDEGEACPVPY